MYITVILPQYLPYQLTYSVPRPIESGICCGIRVSIPVGASKLTTAVVAHIMTDDEAVRFVDDMKGKVIKDIYSIIDRSPIITPEQLKLWHWIASYYMCSVGEVMKYFLPSEMIIRGVIEDLGATYKKNNSVKRERFIHLCSGTEDLLLKGRTRELLDLFLDLRDNRDMVAYRRLIDGGFKSENIRKAILNNIFTDSYETVVNDITSELGGGGSLLTTSDLEIPLLVKSNNTNDFLAANYHLILQRLERGESVLITVSEECNITLPEDLEPYKILYSSSLSAPKRYKNYCSLLSSGAKLVVGSRVAVGLPLTNLSLIIVTDEHSTNYKNDKSPRFVARDVALMLAHISKSNIILESFSPSLESFHNSTIGKYNFRDESEQLDCKITPIDKYSIARRERQVYGNIPQVRYFSKMLLTKLAESHKTLLFHNRRGYNSFLMCKDCGWVLRCNNCNVSMTYHKEKKALVCHYCGQRVEPVLVCGECNSKNLQLKGVGSENIEEGIKKYFPLSSVVRLDSDTVNSKEKITEARRRITSGEAAIVVGTAMTIPYTQDVKFDLIGVIDADTLLNIDDFRAEERAFRMITRLAKRAPGGSMVIQCSNINRPIIDDIIKGDYISMAHRELEIRRKFSYPPFVRITRIYIKHTNEESALEVAEELSARITAQTSCEVSCPNTPHVDKVRGMYIFYLTLKFPKNSSAEVMKGSILTIVRDSKYKSIEISIDVDC